MSETEGRVLISYSADTSQAIFAVGKLSAAQKKQAEDAALALDKQIQAYEKLGLKIKDVNSFVATGAINDLTAVGKLKDAFGSLNAAAGGVLGGMGKINDLFGAVSGKFTLFAGVLGDVYNVTDSFFTKLSKRANDFDLNEERKLVERNIAAQERARAQDMLDNPEDYDYDAMYAGDFSRPSVALLQQAGQRSAMYRRQAARLRARNKWIAAGRPDNRPDDAYQLQYAGSIDFEALAAATFGDDQKNSGGAAYWEGGMDRVDTRIRRAMAGRDKSKIGGFGQADNYAGAAASARGESQLEKMFGPIEQFEAYTEAWGGVQSAVTSAFDAWLTGSKGVVTAMREAVAGFARNLAIEALLQALRHGAYALGSLAFGDAKGAAAHGISAAKWGAVALAAGVASKELGGSGGSGGSASGGAYGRSSNSVTPWGAGGGDRTTNVIIMGGGADESPRENARRTARAVAKAEQLGYSGKAPGVSYS